MGDSGGTPVFSQKRRSSGMSSLCSQHSGLVLEAEREWGWVSELGLAKNETRLGLPERCSTFVGPTCPNWQRMSFPDVAKVQFLRKPILKQMRRSLAI